MGDLDAGNAQEVREPRGLAAQHDVAHGPALEDRRAPVARPLERAVARGLVERSEGLIRPTARGTQFLNDYLMLFQAPLAVAGSTADGMKRAPVDTGAGPPML